MKTLHPLLLLLIAIFSTAHAAPPALIPLETLFADVDMQTVAISPDGRYITWLAPRNQRMNLAIKDRQTNKVRWLTNMKEENVFFYRWVKRDRIVFTQDWAGRETYGMFACDPDGGNLIVIIPLERVEARSDGSGQGGVGNSERDLPKTLVDTLPKDPDHILMNRVRGNSGLGDLIKVNIRTGKESVLERNYINARSWVADRNGDVRVAICTDFQESIQIKYRSTANSDWRTLGEFPKETSLIFDEGAIVEPHWRPIVFAKDNRTLYIKTYLEHDKSAIRTLDPETGVIGPILFTHPRVESGNFLANYRNRVGGLTSRAARDGLIFNNDGDLAGISYDDEYPETKWLEPRSSKLAADLELALPDTVNSIISSTSDGKTRIVLASSDRDPGTFYVYDPAKQELEEIGRARTAIDPRKMSEMRPIRFNARDGWEIPAYLTVPAGREAKNMPMIVVPHGGPYGPRDTWGYSPEVQFLANRGNAIAVPDRVQLLQRRSAGEGEWDRAASHSVWECQEWYNCQGFP